MTLKRACTLMTVKSVNEDERIITGIASTPSPDRDGDIMEPEGAKFRSDTPFLWQHDRSQPIGTCTPKMVKEGLQITAKLVNPAILHGKNQISATHTGLCYGRRKDRGRTVRKGAGDAWQG